MLLFDLNPSFAACTDNAAGTRFANERNGPSDTNVRATKLVHERVCVVRLQNRHRLIVMMIDTRPCLPRYGYLS